MFERFTNRTRRAVVLAQEEARLMHHDHIGTEHILLGVIHEGEVYATTTLGSVLAPLQDAREKVRETIGQSGGSPDGPIPFTPEARKTLELSALEGSRLGHHNIGPEHILLGLLHEEEGAAVRILVQLGADLSSVHRRVVEALSAYEA